MSAIQVIKNLTLRCFGKEPETKKPLPKSDSVSKKNPSKKEPKTPSKSIPAPGTGKHHDRNQRRKERKRQAKALQDEELSEALLNKV